MRCLATLLCAAAVAGCGAPAAVRTPGRTVSITITDFREHPQVVRVNAGKLTFKVRNAGSLPHNFAIRGQGRERLRISTMLPGESGQATVTLPRGDFRMFCSVANHEELGEYGTVEVR